MGRDSPGAPRLIVRLFFEQEVSGIDGTSSLAIADSSDFEVLNEVTLGCRAALACRLRLPRSDHRADDGTREGADGDLYRIGAEGNGFTVIGATVEDEGLSGIF